MNRDVDRVRMTAEELVGRSIGSRAVRESHKRTLRRTARAVGRRLRNAAITVIALFVALVVLSAVTPGGLGLIAWLIAMPVVMLTALLVLFWPTSAAPPLQRRRQAGDPVVLDALAAEVEDWLLERARMLPQRAGPALDLILGSLTQLRPALTGIAPDSAIGGETQRLIGLHLPNLVDTYLRLPAAERGVGSPSAAGLADSLGIVADELTALRDRLTDDKASEFDIERRFLESRYRGNALSLDKPL